MRGLVFAFLARAVDAAATADAESCCTVIRMVLHIDAGERPRAEAVFACVFSNLRTGDDAANQVGVVFDIHAITAIAREYPALLINTGVIRFGLARRDTAAGRNAITHGHLQTRIKLLTVGFTRVLFAFDDEVLCVDFDALACDLATCNRELLSAEKNEIFCGQPFNFAKSRIKGWPQALRY